MLDIRSTSGASGAVLRPVLGRTSWTAHLSNPPSSAFPPQAHMLELCNVLEERNAETLSSSGLHRCCAGVTDPFFPDLASAGEEMSCRARGQRTAGYFSNWQMPLYGLRTGKNVFRPRRVVPIKPNLCPCRPKTGIFPVSAGDFRDFGGPRSQLRHPETSPNGRKPAKCGPFSVKYDNRPVGRTAWLGREGTHPHDPNI